MTRQHQQSASDRIVLSHDPAIVNTVERERCCLMSLVVFVQPDVVVGAVEENVSHVYEVGNAIPGYTSPHIPPSVV